MSINGSVVTEEIISPYLFKQLVSCKRYVLVLHKIEQQVVFLRRKVSLFAVYEYISCRKIDFKTFKFYCFSDRLISGFITFDYRIDAGKYLFGREGLYT